MTSCYFGPMCELVDLTVVNNIHSVSKYLISHFGQYFKIKCLIYMYAGGCICSSICISFYSGIFYSCHFIKSFRPFHSFREEEDLSQREVNTSFTK